MAEFELIDRLVSRIRRGADSGHCVVDIGDDAAVLSLPPDRELAVTTDTLNTGVHFLADMPAHALGHKALAVNLSDLAAMAADPAWFFLAVSLFEVNNDWLSDFAEGMAALASRSGIVLAGGDTTQGPLSLTVTAMGLLDPGMGLTRGDARAGDLVVVSGRPGRAATALSCLRAGDTPDAEDLEALYYPQPRLQLARKLRGFATACIDVSDGLAADLGHILTASGVGAKVSAGNLPGFGSLDTGHLLTGGDDYELCFCLPGEHAGKLTQWSDELELELSIIGELRHQPGLEIVDAANRVITLPRPGYEHFSSGESNA